MAVEVGSAVELGLAALSGGGVVELIRAFRGRRRDRVDPTVTLNDSTLRWAEALQRDSDASRVEAQQAWKLLRDTRQEMEKEFSMLASELHKHRQLAETLTYRYRILVSAIMSPNASLESLRLMVEDPGRNGHNGAGG